MKNIKKLSILILFIFSFPATNAFSKNIDPATKTKDSFSKNIDPATKTNDLFSKNIDKAKVLETTIRLGASKQDLGFDTSAAHSILNWNTSNVDYGLDLKYTLSNQTFVMAELMGSSSTDGKSTDDDIQNYYGVYSISGAKGGTGDFKLNVGYKVLDLKRNRPLFITAGAFYKNAKVSTLGFVQLDGRLQVTNFAPESYEPAKANSEYYGLMFGSRLESNDVDTKSSIQIDFLLPLRYQGDQVWYNKNLDGSDRYWSLNNNNPGIGFRVKAEQGYKISNSFDSYIKFYGYYEAMKFSELTEIHDGVELKSRYKGKANFNTFGGGIAFEF